MDFQIFWMYIFYITFLNIAKMQFLNMHSF